MKTFEIFLIGAAELSLMGVLLATQDWELAQFILLTQAAVALMLIGLKKRPQVDLEARNESRIGTLIIVCFVALLASAAIVSGEYANQSHWKEVGALLLGPQQEVAIAIATTFGLFAILGSLLLTRGRRI